MSCIGCVGTVKDYNTALNKIIQQARDAAEQSGIPQAVYQDGKEYKYNSATYVIENGIKYITILSAHS